MINLTLDMNVLGDKSGIQAKCVIFNNSTYTVKQQYPTTGWTPAASFAGDAGSIKQVGYPINGNASFILNNGESFAIQITNIPSQSSVSLITSGSITIEKSPIQTGGKIQKKSTQKNNKDGKRITLKAQSGGECGCRITLGGGSKKAKRRGSHITPRAAKRAKNIIILR